MANKYSKKVSKKVQKEGVKVAKKHPVLALFLVLVFIAIAVVGYFYFYKPKEDVTVVIDGDLSIHVLELGNGNSGDCIYIKAGNTDMIVDAGSRSNSLNTIKGYVNNYCTDGIIEYLIVTHADKDHIACLGGTTSDNTSLFDYYKFDTIIDFPRTNKDTDIYKRYVEKRDREVSNDGATHYNALECYNNEGNAKREYDLSENVKMKILYNYFYEHHSSDENNYSVCFVLEHGDRKFLFTGDLEEKGEEYLVQYNSLSKVEFYKAGHHGSKTSSTDKLLSVIKPKICAVSCCAGSVEYLTNVPQDLNHTFPTQEFIDNISKYTDKVYVTTYIDVAFDNTKNKYVDSGEYKLLNGNIVVTSTKEEVKVTCSNNDTLLKDTGWFKDNRTCPIPWVS